MEHIENNLICIRDLTITYSAANGGMTCALNHVNLEIREGEVLGILGESGCGKSTLANAVLRLLPANATLASGEILFCGGNLLSSTERELRDIRGRQISQVPQDPGLSLNPVIAVGTQIAEVLRAHLPMTTGQRRARVNELLNEVGFDQPAEIYGVYPHQLSGGQRQRIVIAQAVACCPALVIADEPTSKLDARLRSDIIALLARLRATHGTTLVVISHDLALIGALADRIAVMYAGTVVEIGKRDEILQRPLHPYTQALVRIARSTVSGGEYAKARFPRIEGDHPSLPGAAVGCCFEPRCSERIQMCLDHRPPEVVPEPARSVRCFKYGE